MTVKRIKEPAIFRVQGGVATSSWKRGASLERVGSLYGRRTG